MGLKKRGAWLSVLLWCGPFVGLLLTGCGSGGDQGGNNGGSTPSIEGVWRESKQINSPTETWTWPWTCQKDLDNDGVNETVTHDVYAQFANGHGRNFIVYLNIVDPGGSVNVGGTTPIYYCSTKDGTYTQDGDIITAQDSSLHTTTFSAILSGNTLTFTKLSGNEQIEAAYWERKDPSSIATAVEDCSGADGCY